MTIDNPTTIMPSTGVTTEVTTEEPTTIVNPEDMPVLSHIVMINEQAVRDKLLEFDVKEMTYSPSIKDNFNPYDYEEIKVVFDFLKPSSKTLKQTAFWYRGYDEIQMIGEVRNEEGYYTSGQEYIDWGEDSSYRYRVRITPDEVGTWNYTARLFLNNMEIQNLNGSFEVQETETPSLGIIKVDEVNNRNFIFTKEEKTFIPMGANFAWFATTLGTHDYYNWFKRLEAENANFARIWLSNWSFSIHKFSYTNFDSRQNILARLDYLMNFAAEFDVYIMLTLINHGQFSFSTNPEWAENPYNINNGGMLEYPVQFFYNKEAKAHYKNELMYIISRYGYSENIFAWELFNEVDWIDGYSSAVVTSWHKEMSEFIKANDPYLHMVSTSYKYTFGTPAFDLASLDFANFHSYAYNDVLFYQKLVGEMTNLFNKYQKPVFFGEIGIDWQSGSGTYSADYSGITIHQALWGGMMSSAGSANHWWWDSWIEKSNLWYRMKGASTYATYIDVANKDYSPLASTSGMTVVGEDIKVMGYLLEDRIYGYIYNELWNYWNREPDTVNNASVTIPFADGVYQLLIFNTTTGEVVSETTITVTNNEFVINDLSIQTDYAFIVR